MNIPSGDQRQLQFRDIYEGMEITSLIKKPTNLQLFRFSAVTWNAHRIHYDIAYAATEGYPDVLVQSHMHGSFLVQMVTDWAGPHSRLRRFRWENRHLAIPGDVLTCAGNVTRVALEADIGIVECEVEETNQDGTVCAPGWAVLEYLLQKEY